MSTIHVDGSGYKRLLAPTQSESYLYASGYNADGPLLVVTHKLAPNDKVEDLLFLYSPGNQKWTPVQTAQGSVGRGALSPDGSSVVFAFAPDMERFYKLYIKRPQDAQPVRLASSGEQNETEGYASWRPDSQEVAFVGLRISSGRLVSRLLRVPATGGQPNVVLEDDSPGGAVYSPSGRTLYVLTKKGVEEMELDGANRRLILDWKRLPEDGFRYGCISWCAPSDLIAFATMNKRKESQIWTVSPQSGTAKRIHTVKDGTIEGIFFLTGEVKANQVPKVIRKQLDVPQSK